MSVKRHERVEREREEALSFHTGSEKVVPRSTSVTNRKIQQPKNGETVLGKNNERITQKCQNSQKCKAGTLNNPKKKKVGYEHSLNLR